MERFSALLAICAGNSPVPGEFPTQRPVARSFDVFFEQALEWTIVRLVIWDAIAPIMTSLWWFRHFLSKKCFWQCRLQKISHLVQTDHAQFGNSPPLTISGSGSHLDDCHHWYRNKTRYFLGMAHTLDLFRGWEGVLQGRNWHGDFLLSTRRWNWYKLRLVRG